MPKLFIIITLYFFSQLASMPASGWGWEAHKLICGLSEKKLTSKAKAKIGEWLSQSGELEGGVTDFPKACLWPDMVKHSTRRDTYKHHFINVPDDASTVSFKRDCSATPCIATGIEQALKDLSHNPEDLAGITRRAAALRFLGHYIADLHQPLHVGNASDWGGNKIRVSWRGKETNLHALWDYEMIETVGLKHPTSMNYLAIADQELEGKVIEDWFNESLLLARNIVYQDLKGNELTSGDTISEAYFNRSKPIIIERIRIAAARLAYLLNEIAEGEQIVIYKVGPLQP